MFDRKSDYAQNKREKDAIVYIGVTGPVLLTRATFTSEDEFMKWKLWSDSDYHATEKTGRSYYDNSLPLVDEFLDFIAAVPPVRTRVLQAGRIRSGGGTRPDLCRPDGTDPGLSDP